MTLSHHTNVKDAEYIKLFFFKSWHLDEVINNKFGMTLFVNLFLKSVIKKFTTSDVIYHMTLITILNLLFSSALERKYINYCI